MISSQLATFTKLFPRADQNLDPRNLTGRIRPGAQRAAERLPAGPDRGRPPGPAAARRRRGRRKADARIAGGERGRPGGARPRRRLR